MGSGKVHEDARTRDARSAAVLHVDALPTRLSAPTVFNNSSPPH